MTNHWQQKRQEYKATGWSDKPSIFVTSIVDYLPKEGRLLDLGAGLGQDSLFFAERGFEVVSSDAILDTQLSFPENIERKPVDISRPLLFLDEEFDIVYAHLALHYFDAETTEQIFSEIYRVLKPGGILAFLVNSVNDPEYNTGTKLEEHYFETEGTKKRYFSTSTAREFAKNFEVILCDEKGETYKDQAKGVHNLVRFVGKRKE